MTTTSGSTLLATLAAIFLLAIGIGAQSPYKVLVIGDSLIWGQGLNEPDKSYTLVTDWLRKERFSGSRPVDLKVKAHSGATIDLDPADAEKLRRAIGDGERTYPGEVNVAFPTMLKQAENAAKEYRSAGVERGADLVLVTAGITDISVEGVLNPYEKSSKLVPLVEEVCHRRVGRLLAEINKYHPDALIVVAGYYAPLSPHSSKSKVFNSWLETLNVRSFFQQFVNNPIMRPIVFNKLYKNGIERSRVWLAESNRNLRLAVDEINAKAGRRAAIFVPATLGDEHAVESPKTVLFRMTKDGHVTDPLFRSRSAECKTAFKELEAWTGTRYSSRRCSFAAVGHPDPAGARMYAEAIIAALRPLLG